MTAARDALDVLIVEDEALLAEELAFPVKEAGLREVGRATSSAEAVALAPRFRDLWDGGLAETG